MNTNLKFHTTMSMSQKELIEGAYLSGFEPSSDDLTEEALYKEAEEYLYQLTLATA